MFNHNHILSTPVNIVLFSPGQETIVHTSHQGWIVVISTVTNFQSQPTANVQVFADRHLLNLTICWYKTSSNWQAKDSETLMDGVDAWYVISTEYGWWYVDIGTVWYGTTSLVHLWWFVLIHFRLKVIYLSRCGFSTSGTTNCNCVLPGSANIPLFYPGDLPPWHTWLSCRKPAVQSYIAGPTNTWQCFTHLFQHCFIQVTFLPDKFIQVTGRSCDTFSTFELQRLHWRLDWRLHWQCRF